MKKIFALILLFYSISSAQTFKKVGTTGYGFLEIPATARLSALGEAASALSTGSVDGLFTNPAITAFCEKEHNAMVSYAPWLADTKHQAAGYVFHNHDLGSIGVFVSRLDYGSMIKTANADASRPGSYIILGTFSADAICMGLSYSKLLTDRFSFGISGKYVSEKIDDYSSSNFLFDAGLLYFTGFESLRIAASIQHFGTDQKYIGDLFRMPTILKLGAAYEVIGSATTPTRLSLIAEALHPSNYSERLITAFEFWYNDLIALRGGYKFNYDEEGFTCGLGFKAPIEPAVIFDFSFQDYGRLGSIIRFTLSSNF